MITLQYIIVAIIFIAAVAFIVRKFMPSKGKTEGCSKGCGCDAVEQEKTI